MLRRQNKKLFKLFCALAFVATLGCGSTETVLELSTSPPDATVSVAGYVHPGGSPHVIQFKTAGRYEMTVERDGFKSVTMYVSMNQGERRQQSVELIKKSQNIAVDSPSLKPNNPPPAPPNVQPVPILSPSIETFSLNINSTPSGANVFLYKPGNPDKLFGGVTPVTVIMDRNIPSTQIVVRLKGHLSRRQTVLTPEHGSDISINVPLYPMGSSPPINVAPITQTTPGIPAPPPTALRGLLSVSTVPWTVVYLDGKPMGNTPLVSIHVNAGPHSLIMENRDLGVRLKKRIKIRSGQHMQIKENL